MPMRVPITLWRYLISDVARVLLISLGGLVGVIAFAAAMRPLAEGRVGPVEAARLIGLLAVPMLQFALPFASGLAATLAYHRFAAENEATASMAGGISHRALLAPALLLGLALSVVLAGLSNQVIPRFLKSAEQLLTRDVTRMLINPIERGETIQLGRWEVHADRVVHVSDSHLVLRRVLAHQVDKAASFVEADRVDLWIQDDGGEEGARAVLRFNEARVFSDENLIQAQGPYTDPLTIPSPFRDDPKFLTFSELVGLRDRPEAVNRIEWRRRSLADRVAMLDMIADVDAQLRATGTAVLLRRDDVLTLRGAALERSDDIGGLWTVVAPKGGEVGVDITPSAGPRQSHRARSAKLAIRTMSASGPESLAEEPDGPKAWLRLTLEGVASAGADRRAGESQTDQQTYAGLTTRIDHGSERARQPCQELVGAALRGASDPDGVAGPDKVTLTDARELDRKIRDLWLEAQSKLHERAAFSVSCVLMLLMGAIVALRLRDALPLQVYLWSFFPALACIISISAGQNLTHKIGYPGLFLLWGGVAFLAAFTAAAYARLCRH